MSELVSNQYADIIGAGPKSLSRDYSLSVYLSAYSSLYAHDAVEDLVTRQLNELFIRLSALAFDYVIMQKKKTLISTHRHIIA